MLQLLEDMYIPVTIKYNASLNKYTWEIDEHVGTDKNIEKIILYEPKLS
mgnify:CR=1 FL=1